MIPLRDEEEVHSTPWVTYTLLGLLILIFLWDRNWTVFGQRTVFADLAARPIDVYAALRGGDKEPLLTLFTSAFLHGNLLHIVGNLIFLWVFGPRVEEAWGSWRFLLFYLFFGVAAATTQVFVDPMSGNPMLGASGAIAGVMGAYLLLFPSAILEVTVPPFFFWTFSLPAWLMLGFWFLLQIFIVQPGVANWAHAGGFLVGMLVVMLVGKPKRNHPHLGVAP